MNNKIFFFHYKMETNNRYFHNKMLTKCYICSKIITDRDFCIFYRVLTKKIPCCGASNCKREMAVIDITKLY